MKIIHGVATYTLKETKRAFQQPTPSPRVISNSGGSTSGMMTLLEMAKGLGPHDYVIFCNTGLEDEKTLEFLHNQETVLGVPIIWLEYCRYHRWKQVSFATASRNGEPFTTILGDRRHWKWRPTITETVLMHSETVVDFDHPTPTNPLRMVPTAIGSAEWQLYYHPEKFRAIMDNLGVESEDGHDHEVAMTAWVGGRPVFQEVTVERPNPNPFGLYLPNQQTRFCTQELKIRVMRDYMRSQGHGHWLNLVGIRADEPNRHHNGKVSTDTRFDVEHPLYHLGVRKAGVAAFWQAQPFKLDLPSDEGNCTLCFLKGKGKLVRLIAAKPKKAQWWDEAEQATGAEFSKRQSYADLARFGDRQSQQQTISFWPDDDSESISCACTD